MSAAGPGLAAAKLPLPPAARKRNPTKDGLGEIRILFMHDHQIVVVIEFVARQDA
ncbi:hypothetical protein [Rhizobium sp. BT-226]|uniref:hypothetical protein n=1 Tax=Rhizobium sp. BT-226 TaxID=2986922 RepID=UPI0021F70FAD|nr:hypothetical protein [Rhizobium sp. BT-226]MCW0021346.1 hypothetical protein [Rhizobium sp. BT-226]